MEFLRFHRDILPQSYKTFCSNKSLFALDIFVLVWGFIHNTPFSSYLMNWHNKLEYYITVGWVCWSRTNTLAHWTYSEVTQKMKCCVYAP